LARPAFSVEEFMSQQEIEHGRSLGVAVALGAAMGAALGAATGHVGVWIAAGIAVYIVITLVAGSSNRDKGRARNTK